VANGDTHRRAALQKQRHEMTADEAGSAEYRDAARHPLAPKHYIRAETRSYNPRLA
jgi:hypothetical protein